jgi:ribose 5-phosphate isomerase RpiB
MRIAIGSDHAGFALKEAVKPFLTAADREVIDLGTHSTDPVDYSDYAESVGQALRDKRAERAEAALAPRWLQTGFEKPSRLRMEPRWHSAS